MYLTFKIAQAIAKILTTILKAGRKVFKEAKVDSIISVISKTKTQYLKVLNIEDYFETIFNSFDKRKLNKDNQLDVVFSKNNPLIDKIEVNTIPLNSLNARWGSHSKSLISISALFPLNKRD